MASTLTLDTRVDPTILRRLLAACPRKTVRIRYACPWRAAADSATCHEIEPLSLRVHDGAVYLRAWTTGAKEAEADDLPARADVLTNPRATRRDDQILGPFVLAEF